MKKYFRVWKQLAALAVGSYASSRLEYSSYFLGKLVRFGFFLLLIFTIFRYTDNLAGYSKYEVLLFFLTFNLVDTLAQALFRGIYYFKNDIKTGTFDYVLSKPINPLFFSLSRMTDIIDIIFTVPVISLIGYSFYQLPQQLTIISLLLYLFFIAVSMIIVLSINILIVAVNIRIEESEEFIRFYRESMVISRFPPEIFSPKVQFVFTFIMPVIVMVGYPVKSFLGILSWQGIVTALVIAALFFAGSMIAWRISLRHYSSASS